MMQLHQDYDQFSQKDTNIIVVGPEKDKKFQDYWKKNDFKFIGIPDEKKSVLDLYGQQVKLFKLGRMPAQMLVDKEGDLRYIHYGHSMKDIPENQEILELIDEL